MKKLINRFKQPTPGFFVKLRNAALTAAAVGTAVVSADAQLPACVLKIAEYLIVAGAVATTVSQATVKTDEK